MKLLAFDTSAYNCSISIQNGVDTFYYDNHAPKQQAKLILVEIESLLNKSNLTLDKLDAIAYGCGPGSYTGIRIANSVALGLAFAHNLPLLTISSLACIAQAAYEAHRTENMSILVDARMNQVYAANYRINEHGIVKLIGNEQAVHPEEWCAPVDPWHAIGDGCTVYADLFYKNEQFKPVSIVSQQAATANALLTLARAAYAAQKQIHFFKAQSTYLR